MRRAAVVVVLALSGALACSRTDSDRPVSRAEAPPSVAPPTVPSASASVTVGDAGPPDWVNPAACTLGDVPRTQYQPYVGLNAFIAAADDAKAHCQDGETHGQGRVTVVLGGPCGGVRSLRFAEGPFTKGTKSGDCVLQSFQKIKVHPFLGDDLEITKTFVIP